MRSLQRAFFLISSTFLLATIVAGQQQASSCSGNDPITAIPNRPTFSTTAEAVQCGVLEAEYGFEAARGHQNINGLLKFGATSKLELRFSHLPFERDHSVGGFGDSGVGLKYKVTSQSQHLPTFSVLYNATIPTATHDLGQGAFVHAVQILVSKDFGKHHLDWNEGIDLVGRTTPAHGFDRNYFSALAYSHPLSKNWAASGEVAGFSKTNASTPASLTVLGALTYNVSARLVLDGGTYYAAFGHLPRITAFSGFTYSIADLYHRGRR